MRRTRAWLAVVLLPVLSAGCRLGPTTESIAPAARPQGAETEVRYAREGRDDTLVGELVAVREDGVLLLAPSGLTLVSYEVLSEARLEDVLGSSRRLPGRPSESERARVALFARYPFGVGEDGVTGLLAALGQERLIEIGP